MVQQFWLYFYGLIVTCMVHFGKNPTSFPSTIITQLSNASCIVNSCLVIGLLFGSIGGLVVASVLKKMDNVAKVVKGTVSQFLIIFLQEYSSAAASLLTAVLCAILFPDKFQITEFIVGGMVILFCGIFFYEKRSCHV